MHFWDRLEKPYVVFVFTLPVMWLMYSLGTGRYLPDPAEPFMTVSGIWAAFFLGLSLSLSLLIKLKFSKVLSRYRRFVGLTAFWYAFLHVIGYLVLHAGLSWKWVLEDISQKPYIYFGVIAFGILGLMAVTSTKRAILRLGKFWKMIHRMVYLAVLLVVLHLWLQIRGDVLIAYFFVGWVSVVLCLKFKKRYFLNYFQKVLALWLRILNIRPR